MKISFTRLSLAICLSLGLCFFVTGQARAFDSGSLRAENGEVISKIKRAIDKRERRDGHFRHDGDRRGDPRHGRDEFRRDDRRHDRGPDRRQGRDDNFRHDRGERDHFGDRRGPDGNRGDRPNMRHEPDRGHRPDMDRPSHRPGRP